MPLKRKLLLCIILFCSFSAIAHQKKITGKVTSAEDATSLPGVSVSIKGTKIGATTDPQGNFTINATTGATLVFSYIGYNDKEVVVGSGYNLVVRLAAGNNNLNTVVAIGYGTQKKKEQTAAISTVSGKDIFKSPVSDATNSLVGRVQGLFSQQRSGLPGDNGADIFIRGRASTNSAAVKAWSSTWGIQNR
ncbi:MAG: carboxypeptidase-like regulatory domain-containing protein [Chitinophagaceae bacterium]